MDFDKLINCALAGIGAGQITLAALTAASGTPVWMAIPSGLVGGFCFWTCGWRMHRRYYLAMHEQAIEEMQGRVPKEVRLERNEDGSAVAFVTLQNDEPLLIPVPEEIVAQGLDATRIWLVNEILEGR